MDPTEALRAIWFALPHSGHAARDVPAPDLVVESVKAFVANAVLGGSAASPVLTHEENIRLERARRALAGEGPADVTFAGTVSARSKPTLK